MHESTERKLRMAYGKLISRQAEKITVTDLCKKADVSRATFYIYYKDVDEYVEELRRYMILKLFERASELLRCNEQDFLKSMKKENIFFDEYEIKILESMISGSRYIYFTTFANMCGARDKENSPFSDSAWENYREEIDLFMRGYILILIMGLINYEEASFRSDMRNCRSYYKTLCERFERGL